MRVLPVLTGFLLAASLVACQSTNQLPAGKVVGSPLEPQRSVALEVVQGNPENFLGKTVLVEGQATAVCQKMGCWMRVENAGESAVVRWDSGCGGQYAFPLDIVGKRVLMQASVQPEAPTAEQLAAANNNPDDCPKSYALGVSSVLIVDAQ
jgi:hypothetical protein